MSITTNFRMEDLSFAELIAMERATGEKVTIESLQTPGMAQLAAWMWVAERRTNPALTFEEFAARPMMNMEVVPGDPKAAAAPEVGASPPTTSQGG